MTVRWTGNLILIPKRERQKWENAKAQGNLNGNKVGWFYVTDHITHACCEQPAFISEAINVVRADRTKSSRPRCHCGCSLRARRTHARTHATQRRRPDPSVWCKHRLATSTYIKTLSSACGHACMERSIDASHACWHWCVQSVLYC